MGALCIPSTISAVVATSSNTAMVTEIYRSPSPGTRMRPAKAPPILSSPRAGSPRVSRPGTSQSGDRSIRRTAPKIVAGRRRHDQFPRVGVETDLAGHEEPVEGQRDAHRAAGWRNRACVDDELVAAPTRFQPRGQFHAARPRPIDHGGLRSGLPTEPSKV